MTEQGRKLKEIRKVVNKLIISGIKCDVKVLRNGITFRVHESVHDIKVLPIPENVEWVEIKDGSIKIERIKLPKSMIKIPMKMFSGYQNIKRVTIAEGCEEIGFDAFANSRVERVNIPDSVKVIHNGVFVHCDKLVIDEIPDSVKYIEDYAFKGVKCVGKVRISNSLKIGDEVFNGCRIRQVLIADDLKVMNRYIDKSGIDSDLKIPDSVEKIANCAFDSCYGLKSVDIGKNCRVIGDKAFYCCESLADVTLNSVLTEIGEQAFVDAKIKEITIPKGVKRLKGWTFKKSSLEKVIIEGDLSEIERSCFYCCACLRQVELKQGCKYIGDRGFFYCKKLESIEFPKNLKGIGEQAFQGSGLKSLDIPESVGLIGGGAFTECESLEKVIIHGAHIDLGIQCFKNCKKLKEVIILGNCGRIGNEAFAECKDLERVVIHGDVDEIGDACFFNCKQLKEVKILGKCNGIWELAFNQCGS